MTLFTRTTMCGVLVLLLFGCDTSDSRSCFSPWRNIHSVYEEGATGCACDAQNEQTLLMEDVCIESAALACIDNYWHAVLDGPCMPQVYDCVSPEEPNSANHAEEGCPCNPDTDQSVCNVFAFQCVDGAWMATTDAICEDEP